MKNIGILFILLTACTIVYFIIHAPMLFVSEKKFGNINEEDIDYVEITRDSIQTVLQKEADGTWLANGKATNKQIVDNLIYALAHQRADFPVPISLTRQALDNLNKKGFSVKVFSQNSKKLDFKISCTDTLCIGLVTEKKQPYVLSIPGYDDKTIDYISANASFYFNNNILKYLPSEIEIITVENIENPAESFSIFHNTVRNQFMLFDITNQNFINSFDERKIHNYFSYFNGVEYTKMLDISTKEKRKIINRKPSYRLMVKTNRQKISLTVTSIILNKPIEIYGKIQFIDTNNFYLLMNENQDIALAKWIDFDILLKNLSDFVDK
jgi:sRNA-binding regulator protein Hfq